MNKPVLLILVFAVVALVGFKQYEQATVKETMTIMAKGNLVHISGSNQPFRMRKLLAEKTNVDSKYDYTAVLKLVSEYQTTGWQIKSSNLSTTTDFIGEQAYETNTLYFLLQK